MDRQVSIKVLFFAISKDLAGKSESSLKVKSKISCEELKNLICNNFGLEIIKNNIVLAVNQDYIEEGEIELKDNDELVVLPPLSGG
jgi:molybdopterin converting factor subunit 1